MRTADRLIEERKTGKKMEAVAYNDLLDEICIAVFDLQKESTFILKMNNKIDRINATNKTKFKNVRGVTAEQLMDRLNDANIPDGKTMSQDEAEKHWNSLF
jgi:hypothetical protein